MEITGYEMKLRRRQLGMSQTRLGELTKLSRITIWRIEKGEEVLLSHMKRLAHALGMSMNMEINDKIKIKY